MYRDLDIDKAKNYNVLDYKYLNSDLNYLLMNYKSKMNEQEIIDFVDNFTNGGLTYAIELFKKMRNDIENNILKIKDHSSKNNTYFSSINKKSLEAWCKKNDPRTTIYYSFNPTFRIFDYEIKKSDGSYYGSYSGESLTLIEAGLKGVLKSLINYEEDFFIKNDDFEKEITEFEHGRSHDLSLDISEEQMKKENPIYERLGWSGSSTRLEKRKCKREVQAILKVYHAYEKEKKVLVEKHNKELMKVYNEIMEWNK